MASVDQGKPGSGHNARVVLQSVILYPPPGLPREQEKDWFMDAGRVMEAQFGDNLLEIQFDMDEEHEYRDAETGEKRMSRNHGHARLFPEKDGKRKRRSAPVWPVPCPGRPPSWWPWPP